jgi:lipopolysaccharide/colanic/teichoic acid biosynthesis glycosyltransferase
MVANADDALHRAAFDRFAKASSLAEVGDSTFKLRADPRITRVGKFLRTTSLDELPQLFNVLNGTMSLVGPRPPISYETTYYTERHWHRLAVRPGITGPWQVYGRNRVSFEEMVDLDLDYIAQRSFVTDLKLIVLTLGAIASRKGAG